MVRLARLARARKVEEGRDEVKEGDEVQEEVGRGDRLHAPITMAEWRQPSPPSHAKMVQRRLISRTKYMAVAWVPMICLYLATRTSSLNERCIHAGAQTLATHTRAPCLPHPSALTIDPTFEPLCKRPFRRCHSAVHRRIMHRGMASARHTSRDDLRGHDSHGRHVCRRRTLCLEGESG